MSELLPGGFPTIRLPQDPEPTANDEPQVSVTINTQEKDPGVFVTLKSSEPPSKTVVPPNNLTPKGKATILGVPTREALEQLHEATHFGLCELEILLQQFNRRTVVGKRIDKATFIEEMGHAFGIGDSDFLEHIFNGCDETGEGTINFRHFVSCLSTVYRGTREEIMDFWFRMYDTDKDGMLTQEEFTEMLNDVSSSVIQQKVEDAVSAMNVFESDDPAAQTETPHSSSNLSIENSMKREGLSFENFQQVMDDQKVLPTFATPHQSSDDCQIEAYRDLSAGEREVLAMLGVEKQLKMGESLVEEGTNSACFYFVLQGEVKILRNNIMLAFSGPGSFVGEGSLFNDVKSIQTDGKVKFSSTARASSKELVVVAMDIRDFYPLVFHEHPGATAIMQRLGESMMHRLNQMEEHMETLLNSAPNHSSNSLRLSRNDWDNVRKRLLHIWALRYHRIGRKGKLEIAPTKNVGSAADLSIAYSPGVAEPCIEIKNTPEKVYQYTAKGHLVGVVTNGTAVLGLGNIGPLAAKPVMEGKAVLFKKFADIDAFDIELAAADPDKLIDVVCALEPTFGGINLEDIKAPECFRVERECQARMNIPVFHDDQHGTAIIAGAGLLNGLKLVHKNIQDIRVVVCGCGAAGFTCAKHFVKLGVSKQNLIAVDIAGVVYAGREDLTPDNYLCEVAVETELRSLKEAIAGADVFLGLSAGGLLTPAMLLSMNRDPLVFALANPVPEIDPVRAKETRSDVIMATGRSDFPNQINNVCAFPYMFRGALDCRATCINEEMKLAATMAIAELAQEDLPVKLKPESATNLLVESEGRSTSPSRGNTSPRVGGLKRRPSFNSSSNLKELDDLEFGRDYIIPKPFDERLMLRVSMAVAAAAVDSGVATEKIDLVKYQDRLNDLMSMKGAS